VRIFVDGLEAAKEIERDLFEMGIDNHPQTMQDKKVKDDDDFHTKELIGYSYCITNPDRVNEIIDFYPNFNRKYMVTEIADRLDKENHPVNPGTSHECRPDTWNEFLHDGKFAYTYNERYWQNKQLDKVVEEIVQRPESRQIMLTMYDMHYDLRSWGGGARVPCSVDYQFLMREDRLDLIYHMRSCDFYEHFPYDVMLTHLLQSYVAGQANVKCGKFIHFMGSLHAYKKDWGKRQIF